jgi:hypothetical protein
LVFHPIKTDDAGNIVSWYDIEPGGPWKRAASLTSDITPAAGLKSCDELNSFMVLIVGADYDPRSGGQIPYLKIVELFIAIATMVLHLLNRGISSISLIIIQFKSLK